MRRVLALAFAAVLCPLAALAADEPAPVVPDKLKPLTPAEVRQCEAQAREEVAKLPSILPPPDILRLKSAPLPATPATFAAPAPPAPPAPAPRGLPRGTFNRSYLGHPVYLGIKDGVLTCAGEIKDGEFTCRYRVTCECHLSRDGTTVVGTVTGLELESADPKRVAPLIAAATDASFAFDLRPVGDGFAIRRVRTSARSAEVQPMLDAVTLALTGTFANNKMFIGSYLTGGF